MVFTVSEMFYNTTYLYWRGFAQYFNILFAHSYYTTWLIIYTYYTQPEQFLLIFQKLFWCMTAWRPTQLKAEIYKEKWMKVSQKLSKSPREYEENFTKKEALSSLQCLSKEKVNSSVVSCICKTKYLFWFMNM